MKPSLNSYAVCFSRPFESAHTRIKATCIEDALMKARLVSEQRYRWLRFETDFPRALRAITQIDVCHEGSRETRRWMAPRAQLSLASDDLLDTLKNALANLRNGDIASAIDQLATAVDAAEEGAQ